jgi:hypothetical protein
MPKTLNLPTLGAQPEIKNLKNMTISFQFFGLKAGTVEFEVLKDPKAIQDK